MNFNQSVRTCFKKYLDFNGRASRSEFWYFATFCALADYFYRFLDFAFAGKSGFIAYIYYDDYFTWTYLIFQLLISIPFMSVFWRRLHDVNRSAWWVLIALTGIGMLFPLLYWNCKKGDENENRFGDNPLHELQE